MDGESRPAIAQLDSDEFDVWQAVGGVRGMAESTAPGVVFVALFVITRNLTWSIVAAVALAGVAIVARLISRTPLTQALSGLGGILIGALWAWRTGEAQDFYLWGLFVNAGFALGALVSILVGRPLVGLLVTGLAPRAGHIAGAHRLFRAATWLWAGAFLARIAVQVPLYLNSEVGWLGTARVLMGLPLWALVLWFTWILVRPVIAAAQHSSPEANSVDESAKAPHE